MIKPKSHCWTITKKQRENPNLSLKDCLTPLEYEEHKAYRRALYQRNKPHIQATNRAYSKKWYAKNRDLACARRAEEYRTKPKLKKQNIDRAKKHYYENKEQAKSKSTERGKKYRAQWYEWFKEIVPSKCFICGTDKEICRHHDTDLCKKYGEKSFAISSWTACHALNEKNKKICLDELKKTIPLCKSHHSKLHSNYGAGMVCPGYTEFDKLDLD